MYYIYWIWHPVWVFVGIPDGSGSIYQNWNKCVFTCQPACQIYFGFAFVVSFVNGLSKKFSLSIYCKTFFLCKSCRGAKIALTPPPPLTILLLWIIEISPEKTKTPLPKKSEMVFSDIFGSCKWESRKIKNLYGAKIKKGCFCTSFLVSLAFH